MGSDFVADIPISSYGGFASIFHRDRMHSCEEAIMGSGIFECLGKWLVKLPHTIDLCNCQRLTASMTMTLFLLLL